ncbi:MAG TPA: putative sulfate exporter family transporter [Candidatus Agrococcus pullicola]|uniref:Sulfate exporter family transporter n=1 Tax=Candidatus Agrococcus pullicola TaxID=2838429 RepID=A0A9D1YYR7_9MICO|nr:putative sulfate exporter family transporter [Candidatus Agrococcus pullicola]
MRTLPGLALAVGVAALAFAVSSLLGFAGLSVPALTLCVVFGFALSFVGSLQTRTLETGLGFAGRNVMRLGIVLLGLSVSFTQILSLGLPMVLAVVGLVVVSFVFTYAIARVVGMEGKQPILMAAGFSICGASAIGAMGQATRARSSEQAVPVALVTLFGTIAIVALPLAAVPLGLGGGDFGIWAGAAVHDVGQVVATASVAGGSALAIAVIVKLVRVLCLAPMVAFTVLFSRRGDTGGGKRPAIVPLFIIGFLALVAVRTWVPVPDVVLEWTAHAHAFLLGVALVGLLSRVRIAEIVRQGWRSLAVAAASTFFIAVAALLVINVL